MSKKHQAAQPQINQPFIPKLIHTAYLVLFFVAPLLISVNSTELFEFPKMLFVYVMTALIAGLWICDIAISGKLVWKRSWLDPLFAAVLLTQLVSSLNTLDRYTSFFGYYSRFHGGFWSTICYLLLAVVFKTYAKKSWVQDVILSSLASASLVSLYGIAEHFGVDAGVWVQDVKNRVFSTLGQPNWLAAWLGALLPFAYLWLLRPPKSFWPTVITLNAITVTASYELTFALTKNPLPISGGDFVLFLILYATLNGLVMFKARWVHERIPYIPHLNFLVLIVLMQLTILFTKSRSGILALVISTALFVLHELFTNKKNKLLIPLIITSGFLVLVIGTEWTPSLAKLMGKSNQVVKNPLTATSSNPGISDSTDIRKVVWQGAFEVWQRYPLFGAGTETFAYSYYNVRPKEHNLNSEWDFLYNKAHNEYLNFLANNGVVGTAAIVSVIVAALWLAVRFNKKSWAVLAGAGILMGAIAAVASPQLMGELTRKLLIYPPLLVPLGIALILGCLLVWVSAKLTAHQSQASASGYESAVLASVVSIVVTNFYGFSVVTVALVFFMLPLFALLMQEELDAQEVVFSSPSTLSTQTPLSWAGMAVASVLVIIVSIFVANYYRGDLAYNYSQSYLKSGDLLEAGKQVNTALQLHPGNANYWLQKGLIDAQAAFVVSYKDASDSSGLVKHYTTSALQFTQHALETNTAHVNLYKNAAQVYMTLGLIDPGYTKFAIRTLELAAKLSPTDPQLPTNTALLYQQDGNYEAADKLFMQAIKLKPDYGQAYSLRAQMFEEQKEYAQAIQAYQSLYDHAQPKDDRVLKHIEELKRKLQ